MDRRLTALLGAAALSAVLAQPALAGDVHVGIGIGFTPPIPPPVVAAPPWPWAPAPGHGPAHYYRYYPGAQVYFDVQRGLWFWPVLGAWHWGPALPPHLRPGPRYVVLPMGHERPYMHHAQVVRTYPPGWRGHHHGRGHWRD